MVSKGVKIVKPLFTYGNPTTAIKVPARMVGIKMAAISHGKPSSMQFGSSHAVNAIGVMRSFPRLLSFDSLNEVFDSKTATGIGFASNQGIGTKPTFSAAIAYAKPMSSPIALLIGKTFMFYRQKSSEAFSREVDER